jgi:hypothetical protein
MQSNFNTSTMLDRIHSSIPPQCQETFYDKFIPFPSKKASKLMNEQALLQPEDY